MSSLADLSQDPLPPRVVLYDGTCGFCDASVQQLLSLDRDRKLRYAALQSRTGALLRERFHELLEDVDSLILVDGSPGRERLALYSDAVIGIAALLPAPWSLARHLAIIPRPVRDAAYRFIARHRLRILGKRDSCRLPRPDERELFLP